MQVVQPSRDNSTDPHTTHTNNSSRDPISNPITTNTHLATCFTATDTRANSTIISHINTPTNASASYTITNACADITSNHGTFDTITNTIAHSSTNTSTALQQRP
jgi:hypothetical protein